MRTSFAAGSLVAGVLTAVSPARGDDVREVNDPPALRANPATPPTAGSETGPRLGARSGYSIPAGTAFQGREGPEPLGNRFSGGVPIWLDAGYQVTRHVYIGGYFSFAPLFGRTSCRQEPSGRKRTTCLDRGGHSQIRFGVMGAFHFLPPRKFDPWAGIGFGYEIVNTSAIDARYDDRGERLREPTVVDGSVRGIELLNLQLGADYRATETFRVGPFVSLSVGRYSVSSSDVVFVTSQQVLAGEVDRKPAQHEWLTFGIRGAYNL